MKIFLLIESSVLTLPLIFKAVEKSDKIFIISNHIDHFALIKDVLNTSSLFFQADTGDHAVISHLVDKISKMFCIDAVIPESFSSLFITSKVSSFLKKAGLSSESAHQLSQESWLIQLQAGLNYILNESFSKEEYKVTGVSKNNAAHILSITEKLTSFPSQGKASGYILSPEAFYPKELKLYFTKVIEKLSLNYAPFEVKIGISKNTLILREFNVELALPPVSELIEASMGVDYYDNVLRLFSYENLSLYKKQFLNTGSLFFNKADHVQLLKQHPYVKNPKNYKTLKNQMIKLQLTCGD
jgi:hypothetical protein